MKAQDIEVRRVTNDDRVLLEQFRCSSGEPWEDAVEGQIQGPILSRYLSTPPYFDGHMLVGVHNDEPVLLGAHHIEPSMYPDVGYTELIAVALAARGTLVELPDADPISLGHFMMLTIFKQMLRLGRHPRTFVRVDRRNIRSLSMLDRIGLREERDDPRRADLVQRWGELPQS